MKNNIPKNNKNNKTEIKLKIAVAPLRLAKGFELNTEEYSAKITEKIAPNWLPLAALLLPASSSVDDKLLLELPVATSQSNDKS